MRRSETDEKRPKRASKCSVREMCRLKGCFYRGEAKNNNTAASNKKVIAIAGKIPLSQDEQLGVVIIETGNEFIGR